MKVVSRPASYTHVYVCSQHQSRTGPKSKPCSKRASYGLKNLTVRRPLPLKNVGYLNLLLANQAQPTQQLDNNQARRFIAGPIDPDARYDGHEQGFF